MSFSVRIPSVLLALLLLAPNGALADYAWSMHWEATEPERNALDGRGQFNCVVEVVYRDDGGRCPLEPTGVTYPAVGRRVLDDVYTSLGPQHPYAWTSWLARSHDQLTSGELPDYIEVAFLAMGGNNWREASRGEMPDMITPGAALFQAIYGWWDDVDGDGIAEAVPNLNDGSSPANEWVTKSATVVSFIEPGNRPWVTNRAEPGENDPDLIYIEAGVYSSGYPVLFLDGSLMQALDVTTVADALLSPDGEGRPYTVGGESRVDIDVYVAVAEGPVAALYGTLAGPIMERYGSPSLALCPAECQPGPVPVGATPTHETTTPLLASAWPPYPREWAAGSGSTAAGRRPAFEAGFEPWVDLLPRSANPFFLGHNLQGPLVGRSVGDDQAMAPGWFSLEAWLGVWQDLNRDGFVGRAQPNDPYEGGSRPLPDRYAASSGEFIGTPARTSPDPDSEEAWNVEVALVPDDDWGPAGVYLWLADLPIGLAYLAGCGNRLEACAIREGPIRFGLNFDSTTPGRYVALGSIYMPLGSPGFTVCTEDLWIRHAATGTAVTERVRDCDHLPAWL